MPSPYRSPLLSRFDWLDHAFLPAGERPPQGTIYNQQRHSARVIRDVEALPVKSQDADGLIGSGSNPVAVYTADCLPILLADTRQQQVAAVHGGLKGVLSGVLINAIQALCARGATPDSLYIAIGPAIGPCCYELGQDVMACAQQDDPHAAGRVAAVVGAGGQQSAGAARAGAGHDGGSVVRSAAAGTAHCPACGRAAGAD